MDERLAARVQEMADTLEVVERELADPNVLVNPARLAELGKRHSELRAVLDLVDRLDAATRDRAEALELAEADPGLADELRTLAAERGAAVEHLEAELREALVPTDPRDVKDAILEVRAAAGGDEAAIWAGDLLRMYERYAEKHGLKVEPMDSAPSEAGGVTKAIVAVHGRGAFGQLRFEAGVHRVQRVPKTESQGRIHTSTATVAVLPEVEEVEVRIDPADVRVDVFRSSGPGGQSVNTTDSAVRLTHLPSGLVVTCQDEKSQLQNKDKAFRILRARLSDLERSRRDEKVAGERRGQVGSGERSEKIRTYNYRENRVTDHRIGLTVKQLDRILAGDLDLILQPLIEDDRAARLGGANVS